jgi:hypothetical protein
VRSFINARGTWTYLSASLELPEVRAAQQEAARHFVDLVSAVSEHRDRKTPRENKLQIISMTLRPGEDLIVGRRLRTILNTARKKAKA